MKIFIASDHGGVELKSEIIKILKEKNVEFENLGPDVLDRTDYPLYAEKVALKVLETPNSKGILICKSGHGMVIAANSFNNVFASLFLDVDNLKAGIADDNLNVVCISNDYLDKHFKGEEKQKVLNSIIDTVINTEFKGNERYLERLNMVKDFRAGGAN